MPTFVSAFSKHKVLTCPSGEPNIPIFEYDENGELVDTGKTRNIDAEIQSHKDEVLLSKIIERSALTGETLAAPVECFGDATVLPKDLLDAHNRGQQVQSFVDSLSDDQLKILNDQGFDALVLSVLEKKKTDQSAATAQSEVDHE